MIDHSKQPRNFRELDGATRTSMATIPSAATSSRSTSSSRTAPSRTSRSRDSGCAISKASASLMTSALKGHTQAEAQALFERVHTMLTEGPEGGIEPEELGKLAVLSGVWQFPVRIKCATLAWYALRNALEGRGEKVSTE